MYFSFLPDNGVDLSAISLAELRGRDHHCPPPLVAPQSLKLDILRSMSHGTSVDMSCRTVCQNIASDSTSAWSKCLVSTPTCFEALSTCWIYFPGFQCEIPASVPSWLTRLIGFSEGLTVKETYMMLSYEVQVLTQELPNMVNWDHCRKRFTNVLTWTFNILNRVTIRRRALSYWYKIPTHPNRSRPARRAL